MKRALLILLTPTIIFLALWGLIDSVALPAISRWALEEVKIANESGKWPVIVNLESLELRLFSPRARLRGIEILPREKLQNTLAPFRAKDITARLDLFEIVLGRLQVGSVVINGLEGGLELDPILEKDSEETKPLPMSEIFSWAGKIPVRRLSFHKANFRLHSAKNKATATLQIDRAVLSNMGNMIRVDALAPKNPLSYQDISTEIGLGLSAELTPQELRLSYLRIRRGRIAVDLSGVAPDPANLPISPRVELRAGTEIALSELGEELARFMPSTKLPTLDGTLKIETNIRMQGTSDFESDAEVTTSAVKIGQFMIGDAHVEGKLTPKDLSLKRIELQHPAGVANLTGSRMEFRSPFTFRTTLTAKPLDLQALFQSLNLKSIPVEMKLNGSFPCEGTIQPFELKCEGRAVTDRLVVRSENKPDGSIIVALQDVGAEGTVNVNSEKVSFQSKLRIGTNEGSTDGEVIFDKGFDIRFRTPSVDFKDVENLSNLQFAGQMAIDGSTTGDSESAVFDIKLKGKNFVFENFHLGEASTTLRYRNGHLLFDDFIQNRGRTRAEGAFDLDLNHSHIAGVFNIPSADTADLIEIFSGLWRFPLDLQSMGRGRVQFDGPLDLWKMNYKVHADFGPGRLQGDSFDRLNLKIQGNEGNMTLEQAEVQKNRSLLKASGGISSEQVADINAELSGLRLEESELVSRVRNNIAGQIDLSAQVKGKLSDIDMVLRGSISELSVDDREVAGSFFNMHFTKDFMEGDTTLFGNRIQGDVQIPYQPGASPLRLRIKTTDWPFTTVLALIGAPTLQGEYDSSLTADVDLKSDSGRFDQLDGKVDIREFRVQRGGAWLKNPEPMEASLKEGAITLNNAVVEGPDGAVIRLRGEGFRLDRMALGIRADTDLRLLHLFVPFLDDVGGRLKMEASIGGSLWKPEILGNASLQNAFLKIKGFPHAVEKLQSEIIFSQTRILLQGIRAQLAGGTVEGEGSVQINGYGNMPVNVRLRARNLTMNVPDRVRSSGNADLLFSGKWFPFILSGTYNVSSALVEMEFGGDAAALGSSVRASSYLPKILRQAQFDPVLLDLNIPLEKNIVIRNSMMEGSVTGNLQVKGPPQSPILLGKISTERGSKVIFKDRQFTVETANVTFNNPEEINPEVYVSAQSRVEDYDLSVLVQGPAKNPTIRLSSQPPLSEQDIISLLALGVTSSRLEGQVNSRDQANQLGYEALGLGLSRTGTNKFIEQATGFDVRITSSFDQTKNISVPKLTFTKKMTDRWNAAYSRPISGESGSHEFKVQYQINTNVSAIGSYEEQQAQETSTFRDNAQSTKSIFGLDLEFKREFR